MLIPYNVDRPAKRVPYFTYALMGLNIFVYLISIAIANINLPVDQQRALRDIAAFTTVDGTPPAPTGTAATTPSGQDLQRQETALARARSQADTSGGYRTYWRIEHVYDRVVFDPHYSTLEWFAYRPSNPSLPGLLGSMFIHFGILHLLGNMLFLWVFGRALEDALGQRVFVGAYLLCGLAATLLHHIITRQYAPHMAGAPFAGASGAVSGVLGLFALRFFRTPVRSFYITVFFFLPFAIGFTVSLYLLYTMWNSLLHDTSFSWALAVISIVVLLGLFGRPWAWGTCRVPASWALGVYLLVFNILPLLNLPPAVVRAFPWLLGSDSGTSHWAHIGGFVLGMLYGLMIGSNEEGKTEFMLGDAQMAEKRGNAAAAIRLATGLLERQPANAAAYEVLARAYDKENNAKNALANYEKAIEQHFKNGEREAGARTYLEALARHPDFVMPPAIQLGLGTQLFRGGDMKAAALALAKMPEAHGDAAESEIGLLRSAQLYLHNLDQPHTALEQLQLFRERYPQSEWMAQAERELRVATDKLNRLADEAAPTVDAPSA